MPIELVPFCLFLKVACEDFQLFVTDYGSEKIYILNATGDVIDDFDVIGPVGMAIDTFGLGDIVFNPTVIYSTYPPDGSAKPIYRSQMNGSSAEILYDSHSKFLPSQFSIPAHCVPACERPFKWRFAGGSMMVHFYMFTGLLAKY